jgi:hypothetical protein
MSNSKKFVVKERKYAGMYFKHGRHWTKWSRWKTVARFSEFDLALKESKAVVGWRQRDVFYGGKSLSEKNSKFELTESAYDLLERATKAFWGIGKTKIALELDGLREQFKKDEPYHVALASSVTGDFEIVESFHAPCDDFAMYYAELDYGTQDWCVLDGDKEIINGGL